MFDNLQEKMDRVFKTLRGEAALNEWHIDNALKEIRVALLEADVHFKVVKEFTNRVREKAVGENVLTAFSPAQQVTKIILDTAGRLHVDDELMQELEAIKAETRPSEILFVADAMTGQDAVKSAKEFDDRLGVTGIVLTKLDGDARGGAALSIKSVVNRPIKLVGIGEKYADLDVFHPDRMASRILGMGDVLSLIEKVETEIDQKEAQRLAQRVAKDKFTLEDLRSQLSQVKKMGPMSQIVKMLPGANKMNEEDIDESALVRMQAILDSMTKKERAFPQVIDGKRKKRIAKGSGTSVQQINQLLKQYLQMKKMMRSFSKGFGARKFGKMMKGMPPGLMG